MSDTSLVRLPGRARIARARCSVKAPSRAGPRRGGAGPAPCEGIAGVSAYCVLALGLYSYNEYSCYTNVVYEA